MESHKKVLGIIFIVSAILQLFLMLMLSLFLSTILSFALSQADPKDAPVLELILHIVQYLPAVVVTLLSIPSLLAGIGLLTQQKWAMILALIVGCLKLFSFPIGTAIGVYAIWIYSEETRLAKTHSPNS